MYGPSNAQIAVVLVAVLVVGAVVGQGVIWLCHHVHVSLGWR